MDTTPAPAIPAPKSISFSLTPALILNAALIPVTVVAFFIDLAIAMQMKDHWAHDAVKAMQQQQASSGAFIGLALLFALIAFGVWLAAWIGMARQARWARAIGWVAWGIQGLGALFGGFTLIGPLTGICSMLLTASFAVAWTQAKR